MPHDRTSPSTPRADLVGAGRAPAAGASAPYRRIVVHPLALLGWPPYVIPVDRLRREEER